MGPLLTNCLSANGNEEAGYLPHYRNWLEMVKHLKIKAIQFLAESTEGWRQYIEFGTFLVMTQTTQ